MRICGIKTTHDGGVALIDDGKLIFSYEMEKLDNRERFAKIDDLGIVFGLLAEHGYAPGDIDHFVFDGWYKTKKSLKWFGQEVEVTLAPYRRGLLGDDVFQEYSGTVVDLAYLSYTHYAGHVASGYATSPFARSGVGSYVLSWDAWMFPYLYFIDGETGKARNLGVLFHLIGDSYFSLCQGFKPFDGPMKFPEPLSLAGKIMAYIALGTPRAEAIMHLDGLSTEAYQHARADHRSDEDHFSQRDMGVDILEYMKPRVRLNGVEDADMLASVHTFLQEKLLDGLKEKLATELDGTRNLTIVGGCGLNIKWNSAIRSSGLFDSVWIPPFPNDSGSAIGTACAAMLAHTEHRALDWDVYLGPALKEVRVLDGWTAEECPIEGLAKVLHEEGQPVVFLNGRAELGPRALGNRSILAPAVDAAMKQVLNEVKRREDYRPVAPICLEHRAEEIFAPGTPDPYMIFDHEVRESWVSRVPAIRHLDGTARLQTVNAEQNPDIARLLEAYEQLSGIPLLCNTSANLNGSGFFPDVESAMRWDRVGRVWSDGVLYSKVI
ncbi:carbamoyltransferase N-terminal domain-containing protein [Streptomyces fildesensis]|uniref:carbamoyltransferase N-terminal domain-containing protein n=1 Tax=Streptomyces fildesensis TaxID=375757 RepID=UPI0018E02C71|nr:carbamoyltransferase N-terminal domain-containing protein [Streptomyces fildesensis]